jgi:deazaflavin-dependent oxidoreductase (nitroreductase family)
MDAQCHMPDKSAPMNKFDYVKTRREDVQEIKPEVEGVAHTFIKYFTRLNVWVFKKSNGRLMKHFPGGFPICLVTMTGAKSGNKREVALIHLPYGDRKLIVASQGGMSKHPVWYYNVKANPEVDIMVGGITKTYIARQADDDEKRALWPHLLSLYPDFDQYQARTDRNIPVFVCDEKK